MKKRIFLLIGSILMAMSGPVQAGGADQIKTGEMRELFWEDQSKAIDNMMRGLCDGRSRAELIVTVKELLQAESGLLAYGLDFNDKRLYSRLGRDVGPTEVERFVGLIFSQRMNDMGFAPRSAQATFAGRQFRIGYTADTDTERIHFE